MASFSLSTRDLGFVSTVDELTSFIDIFSRVNQLPGRLQRQYILYNFSFSFTFFPFCIFTMPDITHMSGLSTLYILNDESSLATASSNLMFEITPFTSPSALLSVG